MLKFYARKYLSNDNLFLNIFPTDFFLFFWKIFSFWVEERKFKRYFDLNQKPPTSHEKFPAIHEN